jgi:hypothetical protein
MIVFDFRIAKIRPFFYPKNKMERPFTQCIKKGHLVTKVPFSSLKQKILAFHPTYLVPNGMNKKHSSRQGLSTQLTIHYSLFTIHYSKLISIFAAPK